MIDVAGNELQAGDVVVADGKLAVVRDVYDSGVAVSTYPVPGNGDSSWGHDAFHGCVWGVHRLPESTQLAFRARVRTIAAAAAAETLKWVA